MRSEVHGLIIWVHIHGYFQDVSSLRNPGGAQVKAKDGISLNLQVRMGARANLSLRGVYCVGSSVWHRDVSVTIAK